MNAPTDDTDRLRDAILKLAAEEKDVVVSQWLQQLADPDRAAVTRPEPPSLAQAA